MSLIFTEITFLKIPHQIYFFILPFSTKFLEGICRFPPNVRVADELQKRTGSLPKEPVPVYKTNLTNRHENEVSLVQYKGNYLYSICKHLLQIPTKFLKRT